VTEAEEITARDETEDCIFAIDTVIAAAATSYHAMTWAFFSITWWWKG